MLVLNQFILANIPRAKASSILLQVIFSANFFVLIIMDIQTLATAAGRAYSWETVAFTIQNNLCFEGRDDVEEGTPTGSATRIKMYWQGIVIMLFRALQVALTTAFALSLWAPHFTQHFHFFSVSVTNNGLVLPLCAGSQAISAANLIICLVGVLFPQYC